MRLVEHGKNNLSMRKKCKLLNVNRSSMYKKIRPETGRDKEIMSKIYALYEKHPFYGYRRQYVELISQNYEIGIDRVRQYMRILGLETFYPKKRTSIKNQEH